MASNRRAYVDISLPMLMEMLKTPDIRHRDIVKETNLPEDARVVTVISQQVDWAFPKDMLRVIFESDSLTEVPEGSLIPQFPFHSKWTLVQPDMEVPVH